MPVSNPQATPSIPPSGKPTPDSGNTASKQTFTPRNKAGVGIGTDFNNQYQIEQHSYPSDLMDPQYGYNNVIFYINVSTDSKLLKDGKTATVEDLTPRDRGSLIGANLTEAQVIAGGAAGGVGTAGVAGGGAALSTATSGKSSIGGVIGSGVKTAATGAALAAGASTVTAEATGTQTSNFSRQQKRLAVAIALHIPNQLSIRYGMNWGEEDTNTFMMGAAMGEQLGKALNGANNSDQLKETGSSIASAIALNKGPEKAALSNMSGLAANPRKEQIFKSVDFRNFTFSYEFYPRDADEAKKVLNIINTFKLHMHPEFKDAGNFLYIYPSEFDIFYYQGGKENMNLHRHTSCVLTEMTVNYAPQGQFTTFDNGMPTQINISLNFRELALLTKEKIQDGF